MVRDLPRLARHEYDVLVIGGGIYGLAVAYDAAQRGLSTALVERRDFGSATSFNHLKTLHGGLRYLQTGDLVRVRRSILERRAFAHMAPRYVMPQAFAMPTGTALHRQPLPLRAAFLTDAIIGSDRNRGVSPHHVLPAGRIVVGSECERLFEGAIDGVRSAAVWFDYVMARSERLTLAFALAASQWGATLANYVEARSLVDSGRPSQRVAARDVLSGNEFDIRSRMVVNAGGPWAATLFTGAPSDPRWPLVKAMNLVTSRPAGATALAAPMPGGRALVLLPWNGCWIAGTSESPDDRSPGDDDVSPGEVEGFLSEVNAAFPALSLTLDEITLVHRGLVPGRVRSGRLRLLPESQVIDHARDGAPRLISIAGVKYTTARATAERVVDLLIARLGKTPAPCRTASTILPGAGLHDAEVDDPVESAMRSEMAHTLEDVVVRRTGMGAAGYPGDTSVGHVAARMQQRLGWSPEETSRQIAALKRFYDLGARESVTS